ncbi:phosphatase PAP2 family protein [Candidatus Oleimmundimicrobium sp.]|uniref:phosphatase PAP2 family protein n=1 Tax=Candidatus Oleimmundimicrobium sp. TaxID=3060597 RepID=UPI00271608E2|nr:phosphatase PAP2 family protein [Candidatus Oleimmundimicrobium sp.]MDO8885667.1 phosphatase PAP2 family protein [Candidatus Oleimmundimicrobium sp.]
MSCTRKYLIFIFLIILSFIFDKQIVSFVANQRVESLNPFISFFKELWVAYILFALLSLYFLLKKEDKWLPAMWLSITSATLISETLKIIIARPRPYEVLPITPLGTHCSYSFPSGHITLIFSIVALLGVSALAKHKEVKLIRYVWLGYALAVGLNRIYIGVHYLSDIIAGCFLGYTVGFFWVWMQNNRTLDSIFFKKWWWLIGLLFFLARISLIKIVYS